jgi:hypothetical protein
MTRMTKTDGENGKSGPKMWKWPDENVKVDRRKCESGPTENRYARGGPCLCKKKALAAPLLANPAPLLKTAAPLQIFK